MYLHEDLLVAFTSYPQARDPAGHGHGPSPGGRDFRRFVIDRQNPEIGDQLGARQQTIPGFVRAAARHIGATVIVVVVLSRLLAIVATMLVRHYSKSLRMGAARTLGPLDDRHP